MHPEMERIQNCLAAVRRHTDFVPEVAVVLGSGLGGFADMVKQTAVVPYSEIPWLPGVHRARPRRTVRVRLCGGNARRRHAGTRAPLTKATRRTTLCCPCVL